MTLTKERVLKFGKLQRKTTRPVSGAPGQEVIVYEFGAMNGVYPAAVTSTTRPQVNGKRTFTLVQSTTPEGLASLVRYETSKEILAVLTAKVNGGGGATTTARQSPTAGAASAGAARQATPPSVLKVRQALGVDPACGSDLDVEDVF